MSVYRNVPPAVQIVLVPLRQEIGRTICLWQTWRTLYLNGGDNDNVRLLNEKIGYFVSYHWVYLVESVALRLVRLSDKKAIADKNQCNLAQLLATAKSSITDHKTYAKFLRQLSAIGQRAKHIELHRHNAIAHLALEVADGREKLPRVEFVDHDELLQMIVALYNDVIEALGDTRQEFGAWEAEGHMAGNQVLDTVREALLCQNKHRELLMHDYWGRRSTE